MGQSDRGMILVAVNKLPLKVGMKAMAQRMNPTVHADANKILEFLSANAEKNWVGVMTQSLTEEERKAAHAYLAKLEGIDTPYGAYAGGTGALKEAAEVENQEAIQVLKAANRLLQCGKGRGKCQIVIDVTELSDEEFRRASQSIAPKAQPAEKPVAKRGTRQQIAEDPTQQLRQAFDAFLEHHSKTVNERNEAMAELQTARDEVAKLRGVLESMEKLRAAATW